MKRENKASYDQTKYRDEEYFERVARRKKVQEQTARKYKPDRARSYQEEKAYYENSKKVHAYGGQYRRPEEERRVRRERSLDMDMMPGKERRTRSEQVHRSSKALDIDMMPRQNRQRRPEQGERKVQQVRPERSLSADMNPKQVRKTRLEKNSQQVLQANISPKAERKYRKEQAYRQEQARQREQSYRQEPYYPEERNSRPEKSVRSYDEIRPKKKAGKAKKILIGILIFIVLLAIGAGVVWFNPELKTKAIKFALNSPFGPKVVNSIIGDNYEAYVHDKNLNDSEIRINDGAKTPDGNITIALFGVDARAEDLTIGTNADSMIIVNVDPEGNILMGSIYRDTYLMTRGRGGDEVISKANSAYFRGGPLGAINMLNENWDMAITDYVVVNFSGMTNIINLLGGLRLKVTAEERDELNYHMYEQDAYAGQEYVPLEIYGDEVVLTGSQATAFSRLRSVPFESPDDGQIYSDDYGRTARQRYVLTELLAQAREQGMLHLLGLMNELFEANSGENKFIQTSLDIDELTALAAQAFDMNMGNTAAFPDEEHQYNEILDSGDSIVADTLEENVSLLHQFLYGTENYQPTQDLRNLAERIRNEVDRQTD